MRDIRLVLTRFYRMDTMRASMHIGLTSADENFNGKTVDVLVPLPGPTELPELPVIADASEDVRPGEHGTVVRISGLPDDVAKELLFRLAKAAHELAQAL